MSSHHLTEVPPRFCLFLCSVGDLWVTSVTSSAMITLAVDCGSRKIHAEATSCAGCHLPPLCHFQEASQWHVADIVFELLPTYAQYWSLFKKNDVFRSFVSTSHCFISRCSAMGNHFPWFCTCFLLGAPVTWQPAGCPCTEYTGTRMYAISAGAQGLLICC